MRLFLEIWELRPDLQRLYPLTTRMSRLRYLRWLIAGGLAAHGVEFAGLPSSVRRHPLMRLAELSVRRYVKPAPRSAPVAARRLLVMETTEGAAVPAGALAYDAATGRFQGAHGASPAPDRVELVCFLTAPALVPADAIALHAKGVRWPRAVGAWTPEQVNGLAPDDVVHGFVDEAVAPEAALKS